MNAQDQKADKEVEDNMAEMGKIKNSKKLWKYQSPRGLLFFGFIISFVAGASHPMTGMTMAGMMSTLTTPLDKAWIIGGEKEKPEDPKWGHKWLKVQITEIWCVFFACLALYNGTCQILSKMSFSTLSENVTFSMRRDLYKSILQKNIGWFDFPMNGVSVLTSAMAADTSVINGTASESIAP